MKQKRKKLLLLIVGLSAVLLVAVIISCSDDNWPVNEWQKLTGGKSQPPEPVNTELTIDSAKVWFDKNYLPVLSLRTGRTVETTKTTGADESERLIKPYWKGAKEENWGDWEAVLLPIRARHSYIMYDEETKNHWTPGDENSDFIRNVAHVVVLKNLRTGHIRSFMEVFVGSYEYLKKRRIDKNSYLSRDSLFDGSVHFYELDGTFINGWMYTDGKITGRISESDDNSRLELRSSRCNYQCWYETEQYCYDTTSSEFDEEYGWGPTVTRTCYPTSYERCNVVCEYYDDGSSSGGSGSGSSGNSSIPPGLVEEPDVQESICKAFHGILDVAYLKNNQPYFTPPQEQFIISLANLAALYELRFSLKDLQTDLENYSALNPLYTKYNILNHPEKYISGWELAINSSVDSKIAYVSPKIGSSKFQLKYYPEKNGEKNALGLVKEDFIGHSMEFAFEYLEYISKTFGAPDDWLYDMHLQNSLSFIKVYCYD